VAGEEITRMVKLVQGERVGRQANLVVKCVVAVFDESGQRLLLTRRAENGRWCLPGGKMEPGESAAEACARELWEETGLRATVERLVGVYSTPHCVLEYADGSRCQLVALLFQGCVVGGELLLGDEVTEVAYFGVHDIATLDILETHQQRISDVLASSHSAFVR